MGTPETPRRPWHRVRPSRALRQVTMSGAIKIVKERMKSVSNIAKITKAMQMVAASKLRGAETRVIGGRPMADALSGLFGALETGKADKVCVVPMTSDKGLCGGVNTQIVKLTRNVVVPELKEGGSDVSMVCVGDKGRSSLRRSNLDDFSTVITGVFAVTPTFSAAACIAADALATGADSVVVVYNKFQSAVSQIPTTVTCPSFKLIDEGSEVDPFEAYEIESERQEILENFAEFNLAVTVYGAMLENNCSEIASRMANDMFDALELKYNKARQAAITTELIEIISGA